MNDPCDRMLSVRSAVEYVIHNPTEQNKYERLVLLLGLTRHDAKMAAFDTMWSGVPTLRDLQMRMIKDPMPVAAKDHTETRAFMIQGRNTAVTFDEIYGKGEP